MAYPLYETLGALRRQEIVSGDVNNLERSKASLVSFEASFAPGCISGGASAFGAVADPPIEKPDSCQPKIRLAMAATLDYRKHIMRGLGFQLAEEWAVALATGKLLILTAPYN